MEYKFRAVSIMELYKGQIRVLYNQVIPTGPHPFCVVYNFRNYMPWDMQLTGRKLWIEEVGRSALLPKNEDHLIRGEN